MPDPTVDPVPVESYFAWWVLTEKCISNMLGVLGYRVVTVNRSLHLCRSRPEAARAAGPICLASRSRRCRR